MGVGKILQKARQRRGKGGKMSFQAKDGENLVCPRCGSIFVEWYHHQKRMRCLVWKCGWIMENECAPDDTSALLRKSSFKKCEALRGS